MDLSKWTMLISCCFLNFIVGFNVVDSAGANFETIYDFKGVKILNEVYTSLIPIFYVIFIPIFFCMVFKSFYWSVWLSWIFVVIGLWIKFFAKGYFPVYFLGQVLIIVATGLVLPCCGSLTCEYFPQNQRLLGMSMTSIPNFLALSLAMLSSRFYNSFLNLLCQASIATILSVIFLLFSDKKEAYENNNYNNFGACLKYLFKDSERRTMLICTSLNVSVIFIYLTSYDSNQVWYEKFHWFNIKIIGLIFCTSGILGAISAILLKNRGDSLIHMVRVYLVASVIASFLCVFGLKIPITFNLFNLASGFFMLGGLPLQLIMILDLDKDVNTPFAVNIIYFLSGFFAILLKFAFIEFEKFIGITGLWVCVLTQLFSVTSYLSEFNPDLRKIKKSLL